MADKKKHYVDNKKFLADMIEFRDSVIKAQENGEKRPSVPVDVAKCILEIATHLSYRPNFINYTYRDEMVADAIENCLLYIDNFNPEKSKNPFSYFTTIAYYAFLRRIAKEKKYLYTKYKATENANLFGEISDTQEHDSGENFNDIIKYNEYSEENIADFIENFEKNLRRPVKKRTVD